MTAYEAFADTTDGRKRLASARLRFRVLEVLHEALERSKLTKSEVSRALGIRKSAVGHVFGGDGNLRVNTLAEYLDAMNSELEIRVVPTGAPRVKRAGHCPSDWKVFSDESSHQMAPIVDDGRVRPDSVRPTWGTPLAVSHG